LFCHDYFPLFEWLVFKQLEFATVVTKQAIDLRPAAIPRPNPPNREISAEFMPMATSQNLLQSSLVGGYKNLLLTKLSKNLRNIFHIKKDFSYSYEQIYTSIIQSPGYINDFLTLPRLHFILHSSDAAIIFYHLKKTLQTYQPRMPL
jgi:hypothetical protein